MCIDSTTQRQNIEMETTAPLSIEPPKGPVGLDKIREATFFFGSWVPYMLRLMAIFVVNYLNIYLDSWAVLVTSQTHLAYIVTTVVFLVYFFWNTAGLHVSILFWLSVGSATLGLTNVTALNVQYFSSELEPKLIPADVTMSASVFAFRLAYCGASLVWDLLSARKALWAVGVEPSLTRTLRAFHFPSFFK